MTKMIGFIKFGNGCVKADSVQAIERYLDAMIKTPVCYRVAVHLTNGNVLKETFKTEEDMEARYRKVCEMVSESNNSAALLESEID